MTVRLEAAAAAVDAAAELTTAAAEHLARGAAEDGRISVAKLDRHQVLAYDLAHAASALEGCRVMLDYGGRGGAGRGLAGGPLRPPGARGAREGGGLPGGWGGGGAPAPSPPAPRRPRPPPPG